MLGWPGRVCRSALTQGHELTLYNLGVRGDTSAAVRFRWKGEVASRAAAEAKPLVVFSFGLNDCFQVDGTGAFSIEPSTQHTHAILEDAAHDARPLFVGPAPVSERPPLKAAGWEPVNDRIRRLNRAFATVAANLLIPYLDLYPELQQDRRWRADLAAGDGVHPSALGYEVIADLVTHWPSWEKALGSAVMLPSGRPADATA